MHSKSPAVERMPVHLPGQQSVRFNTYDDPTVIANQPPPVTMLTDFFALCARDPAARSFTYHDVVEAYLWNKKEKRWQRRRNQQAKPTIGRMYSCHPAAGERFYLRLLLTHVRGPTSFESLRTVDGVLYDSFMEAALQRGLLVDDGQWYQTFQEAAIFRMPAQTRDIFAYMLLYGPLHGHASDVWEAFKDSLCEDKVMDARSASGNPQLLLSQDMVDAALRDLQTLLLRTGGKPLGEYGMPVPPEVVQPEQLPRLVMDQLQYDRAALHHQVQAQVPTLNTEQRALYDEVTAALDAQHNGVLDRHRCFFVYSPGGCGKTFTFNLLLASARSQGKVALAVASSGIAALLLDGGRTAHSQFKIPIKLSREAQCNVPAHSEMADLMRAVELIVWDEAPMAHKGAIEKVHEMLCDIMKCDLPFGVKVVVLGGDFR